LARFEAQDNEIWVADGAYPFASGMSPMLQAGAGLIVRINWRNVPVLGPEGQRFEIHSVVENADWAIRNADLDESAATRLVPVPSVAAPIPPEKPKKPDAEHVCVIKENNNRLTKILCRCRFCPLTDQFTAETWSGQLILALYRMRWQIELCIKRLKSLLNFDHLRAKDPRVVQTICWPNC